MANRIMPYSEFKQRRESGESLEDIRASIHGAQPVQEAQPAAQPTQPATQFPRLPSGIMSFAEFRSRREAGESLDDIRAEIRRGTGTSYTPESYASTMMGNKAGDDRVSATVSNWRDKLVDGVRGGTKSALDWMREEAERRGETGAATPAPGDKVNLGEARSVVDPEAYRSWVDRLTGKVGAAYDWMRERGEEQDAWRAGLADRAADIAYLRGLEARGFKRDSPTYQAYASEHGISWEDTVGTSLSQAYEALQAKLDDPENYRREDGDLDHDAYIRDFTTAGTLGRLVEEERMSQPIGNYGDPTFDAARGSITAFDESGRVLPWQTFLNLVSDAKAFGQAVDAASDAIHEDVPEEIQVLLDAYFNAKTVQEQNEARAAFEELTGMTIREWQRQQNELLGQDPTISAWGEHMLEGTDEARFLATQYGIPTYLLAGSTTRENADAYQQFFSDQGFWGKAGLTAGTTIADYLLSMVNAGLVSADALSGGRLGSGDGTASSVFHIVNFLQNAGSGLSGQAFAAMREGASWLGKLALDLEKTGLEQMIDLALGGGAGGLVPMGIRVAGAGAQESEDRGEGLGQQLLTAGARTVTEVGTELMSGVGGSWRGTGYGDQLLERIGDYFSEGTGSEIVGQLAQAFAGEQIEEMVADVVNPTLDRILGIGEVTGRGEDQGFMQKLSNYFIDIWSDGQILYDGLLGGLAGALGAGTSYASQSVQTLVSDMATYKTAAKIAGDPELLANIEELTGHTFDGTRDEIIVKIAAYLTSVGEAVSGETETSKPTLPPAEAVTDSGTGTAPVSDEETAHVMDFVRGLTGEPALPAMEEVPDTGTGTPAVRAEQRTAEEERAAEGVSPYEESVLPRAEEISDSGTGTAARAEEESGSPRASTPTMRAEEVTDSGTGAAPAAAEEAGSAPEAAQEEPVSQDEETRRAMETVQAIADFASGKSDALPEGMKEMTRDEAEGKIVELGRQLGVEPEAQDTADDVLARSIERVQSYASAVQESIQTKEEQARERTEIVGTALSRAFGTETELTEGEKKTLSDAFLSGPEMKLNQYATGVRAAYRAGMSGVSLEQALSAAGDRRGLSAAQFRTAWELGARKAGMEVSASDLQSAVSLFGAQAGEVEAAYQAGQDVSDYAAGMNKLVQAVASTGRNAQDIIKAAGANDVMRTLTPEQIALAQRLGDERGSERRGKVRNQTEKRAEQRRKAEKISAPQERAGRVVVEKKAGRVGEFQYEGVDESKLSGKQKTIVEATKMIAEATGLEIRVIKATGRMGGAYQGNGVIYLNIASGMNLARFSKAIAAGSLSHEMTHWLQEYAPEQYEELRSYIVGAMSAEELDRLVRQQQAAQPGLSYDGAIDEIVANACQPLLRDTKAIQELALEHRTLVEKIRDFIKSFTEKIRAAFEGVNFHDNLSIYQAVQAVEKNLEEIQGLWDAALREAATNMQAEAAVRNASQEELSEIEEDEALPFQTWDEMTDAEREQEIQNNIAFNEAQTRTGSPLKTLKGSDISRGGTIQKIRYPVGKVIGGRLYLHKSYVDSAIAVNPAFGEALDKAEQALLDVYPDFEYICLNYHPASGEIQFQQAPGFDTEREPVVGYQVNVAADGTVTMANRGKPFGQIWHHKWQWVGNDYKGFDVRESWEWSKQWLSTILGASKGGSIKAWNEQLAENGLPEQEKTIRYQLALVDPVQPTSDAWERSHTEPEALSIYPDMWDTSKAKQTETEEEKKKRDSTQRENTLSTYRSIFNILKRKGFTGKILDASSGLGFGTALGRSKEFGFDVEDIEPYPGDYKGVRYTPMYTDYSTLFGQYDAIISSAVLNVVAQDQRDALVVKMGQLLKAGGQMYVTTRTTKDDVDNLGKSGKNVQLGPHEFIETVHNHYQKGFTNTELQAYLQDALGDDFIVEIARGQDKFNNNTAVIVTKKGQITLASTDLERYELLKRASVQPANAIDGVLDSEVIERLTSLDEMKAGGTLRGKDLSAVQDVMRKLAAKLEINRINLENSGLSFPFSFSNRNISKSANHQKQYSGSFTDLAKALSCIQELVNGAQLIETHREKKIGTTKANKALKQTYVLLGAMRDGTRIIPVELVVKEFYTEGSGLYMTVTLSKTKDLGVFEKASAGKTAGTQSLFPKSNISIQNLIEEVNEEDSRLLKYFPDQMLTEEQRQYKYNALERQERDYDAIRVNNGEYQYQTFTFDDDAEIPTQEFGSADTSINDKKLPATFNPKSNGKWVHFAEGGVNIDVGGGRFDNATEFLRDTYDVTNMVLDPYNRSEAHNTEVVEFLRDGNRADTVTCNNVLNVIKEEAVRSNVILECAKALKPEGEAYFYIFEGDKNKIAQGPQATSKGWQNYWKTERYMDEVRQWFGSVERHGQLIVASNPKSNLPKAFWQVNNEGKNLRFQLIDEVEETDRLVAVHNKSVSGLKRMLARGGVPFPSIAIKKAGSSHEGFGDVSIVFPRSTIDPEVNRQNRLYSNDAWTPTEPRTEYEVVGTWKLRQQMEEELGTDAFRATQLGSYLEENQLARDLETSEGDIVRALKGRTGIKYAYLKSIGQEPEAARKEKPLDGFGRYKNAQLLAVFETIPAAELKAMNYDSAETLQKVADVLQQQFMDSLPSDAAKRFAERRAIYTADKINPQIIKDALRNYEASGGAMESEIDDVELNRVLRDNKAIEEDPQYQEWIRNRFGNLIKDSGIPNGKGIYTDTGNRRSFKARHVPATLENIVAQMRKEQETGIGLGGINLRGAATKAYSSVEEMRRESGKLLGKHIFDEEYDSYMKEFGQRLDDLTEAATKTGYDVAKQTLLEAVRDSKNKADMRRRLQGESRWIKYSDDLAEGLWQLKQDVQNMPAPYFEAKPRRIVYPEEALAYILPDNADKSVLKALQDRGYNVMTYEAGNEQDRLAKLNSVEGAQFQIIGEDVDDNAAEARGREVANARIQSENLLVEETVKGLQEIVKRQKTTIEKLMAKMRRTTTPEVRESDAKKLARELISQFGSEADAGSVAEKLKVVGDMLLQSEKLDSAEIKNAARAAAQEILSQSYTDPNPERETYREIARWIRGAKLVVSREDMGELDGGFSEFHKRNFGRINVASRENVAGKSGYQEIDSFYGELATQFAGYVPPASQFNSPGEMLQELEEIVRMAQPEKAQTYGLYMAEATENLANQIVMDALNGVMRQTAPTMADRQQTKTEALRDEIKALQKENRIAEREAGSLYRTIYDLTMLLDRADSRYTSLAKESEIRMAEIRENSRARIEELKAKHLADTTKLKAHFLQMQKNATERRNESAGVKKYRKQVEKKAKALYELLATNSDEKHVPEVLKGPLSEFLQSIDFTSRRALAGGPETQADRKFGARLLRLEQILANQQRALEGDGEMKQDLGGYIDISDDNLEYLRNISEMIAQALTENRDFTINQMTAEDLKHLSELLSNLGTAIRGMNQFMANARYETIREAADRDITNMELLGKAGTLENGSVIRFLGWEEGVPYYVFRRFGAGGVSIFEGLTRGWEKMAMNAQEIIGFTEKTYTDKEVREWKREIREFELEDGRKIKMTVGQIMALSQLLGRAQALQHIERGGIRIGDIETKRGKLSDAEHYHLTEGDITKIVGSLSDRQLQVAQEMRHYMATRGAEWGNEVSMRRFGYNFYGEEGETYFPIQTDSNDRPMADTDAQKNSMFRLLNLSASKSLNPKASNALIVNDIFDVFSDHMADMAKLNGMGLPILDAIKWFSYKQRINIDDEAGSYTTRTLQGAMENAFGSQALRWFKTLMRDINGQTESGDRGTNLFTKFLGNYKAAAVAANLRVALLQPTSYLRATTVLKPQYLAAALAMKSGYTEAMRWSGTAVWKSLGYYDTDISKSMRAQIQHDDSLRDKIVEKSMYFAELGDQMTWGRLWNACKLQARAENKTLRGDNLMRATADLFREVVYSSQVMDATLTRSEIMRGKSAMSKMSSAFMAEPTLSYNILLDAASSLMMDRRRYGRAAWGRNAGKIGKAFTVYTASAAFAALVESIADAIRDDDDDEFWQKWIEAFWGKNGEFYRGNIFQDVILVNKLPFFKDLLSIIQGYASNNMSISAFVTALDAYRIWEETYKLSTGELEKATKVTSYGNMTNWGKVYKTLQALSQLSGIAVSNVSRDAVAIWNTSMQIAGHEERKILRYESNTDRSYGEYVRGTGVSRSQYDSILEDGASQDKLGATLEEMLGAGKLTEEQAKAIWDSRGWKTGFDKWRTDASEAAAAAEERSRKIAATGLSEERYESVMSEANADGKGNAPNQSELGEYLLAGIRTGTFTERQAELIWNSMGWKTSFAKWRK